MKTQNATVSNRREIKVNKVVNIAEDGEILVLDGFFKYSDNFKGATGSRFYPVSKQEYKDRTAKDEVIEHIIECGIPKGYEREGANGVYKAMKANDEIEDFTFDTSYREMWDYLRKECGLNKTTAYIFECIGGGRCFDENFTGNRNVYLSKWIRKFEKKQ